MSPPIAAALLILFAIHLVAFARLGWKRRQAYYLSLVLTFALLTASFAMFLFAPDVTLGAIEAYRGLRMLAWGAALVSLSWTGVRLLRRRGG
ncbi:MAG: hypothetical protein ACPGJE_06060 [Wenzhouxiangellaceae bacterium]